MQTAPAVSVCCCDGGVVRLLTTLLSAGACAAFLAWSLAWLELGASFQWSIALTAAAATAAVVWRLGGAPPGQLDWDGTRWLFSPDPTRSGEAGHPVVVLDGGPWLMLRFDRQNRRSVWVTLSRTGVGAPWRALRLALHAPGQRSEDLVP